MELLVRSAHRQVTLWIFSGREADSYNKLPIKETTLIMLQFFAVGPRVFPQFLLYKHAGHIPAFKIYPVNNLFKTLPI